MTTRHTSRFPRRCRLRLTALTGAIVVSGSAAGSIAAAMTPTPTAPGAPPTQQVGWSVTTREYLDLWLHGFAMLTSDTSHVPVFERGYRQRMLDLKKQRGVLTLLEVNHERLSARFAANPGLVNAQFVAMYFASFDEIVNAASLFARAEGDPRRSNDPTVQSQIALLAANFPSPADRTWLRVFVESLQDERNKFYHAYWTSEQQTRAPVLAELNVLWQSQYYAKFRRFLNNTQQTAGELILSLPLGGEGRTINDSKRANAVAVGFPQTAAAAPQAIYVFAHEAVNNVAQTAITDNVTPAEQRTGVVAGYSVNATVRGGALLLQRIAPELVAGYMRYYLVTAGATAPSADPAAAFNAAFPLPDRIRDAMSRQIELILGGI